MDLKDLAGYGGTLMMIILIFCSLELMWFHSKNGIEQNDYLLRISEANNHKTRIPGFLLPLKATGVKIDSLKIEDQYEFGYRKDTNSLALVGKKNARISINVDDLSPNFLNKNKNQIIKLIVEKQIDRVDIFEFLDSQTPSKYIDEIHKKGGNLSIRKIVGVMIVDFIKSHWHWDLFQKWVKDAPEGGYYQNLIRWLDEHMNQED